MISHLLKKSTLDPKKFAVYEQMRKYEYLFTGEV